MGERKLKFQDRWMFNRVLCEEEVCRKVLRAALGIEVGGDSLSERRADEGAGGGEPRRPHGRVRPGGKPRVRHRDAGLPRGRRLPR